MDKIIPISDLQTKAKQYVEQVKKTNQPVIITQRGRAAAVLVNYETYEGHVLTQDEQTYSDWETRLARANKESAGEKGVELDAVVEQRLQKSRLKKAG